MTNDNEHLSIGEFTRWSEQLERKIDGISSTCESIRDHVQDHHTRLAVLEAEGRRGPQGEQGPTGDYSRKTVSWSAAGAGAIVAAIEGLKLYFGK